MPTTWTKNAKEGFAETFIPTNPILSTNTDVTESPAVTTPSTLPESPAVTTPTTTQSNSTIPPTMPPNSTDIPTNSDGIPDFGDLPFDGKSFDELILMKGIDVPNTPPPDLSKPNSIQGDVDSLMKDFNSTKAKDLYKKMITSIIDFFRNLDKSISEQVLYFLGNNNSADANYLRDMEILSGQFSRWITIVTSYFVVLNWWYILCYTNFTFDFRKFIWEPLKYVMAPAFNSIESINYHFLNIRMDSEPRLFGYKDWISNEDIRSLWHWRPIVFTLFHLFVAGASIGLPVSNEIAGILNGSGNAMIVLIAIVLSYYYWAIMMFVEEKLFEKPMYTNNMMGGLLLLAILIGTALAVPIFVSIICVFFFMYLMYISNLSLFIFNGFNPFSIWSSVNEMFDDLRGAYVTPDDPTTTSFEKLQKLLFRNAHSVYVFFIVFTVVLSINITECFKFSSKFLIMIGVIFNLICVSVFIPNSVKTLKEIWNLILTMLPNNANQEVVQPEE
jgi:hypothetical protein